MSLKITYLKSNTFFKINHLKLKNKEMKKYCLIAIVFALSCTVGFSNNGNTKEDTVTKSILTGEWVFTGFSYDIIDNIHGCGDFVTANGAHLTLNFNENGTYTKTFGNDINEISESGIWKISKDNKTVNLFPNDYDSDIISFGIENIDTEEIELKLDIESAGLSDYICSAMNILTFNKNILATTKMF